MDQPILNRIIIYLQNIEIVRRNSQIHFLFLEQSSKENFFSSWMRIVLTSVHSFTVLYFATHTHKRDSSTTKQSNSMQYQTNYNMATTSVTSLWFQARNRKRENEKKLFHIETQNACIRKYFFFSLATDL
jgi:hypothetical protein